MLQTYLTKVLGTLSKTDDEDIVEPITYGPTIDTILSFLLPFVMMFFNSTPRRVKANAALVADFINGGGHRFHFMEDESTLQNEPDTSKILKLNSFLGIDVKIRSVGPNVIHNFVYSTDTIVEAIHRMIKQYLPEEWSVINVAPFFEYLCQLTEYTVEADLNDI